MSVDPVEPLSDTSSQALARLRRLTHARLLRLRASATAELGGPSLIIVGYVGEKSEVIGHGFEPAHDAVFGLDLAPKFDAVAVFARSVVAAPDGRHRDGWCAVAVDRSGASSSFFAIDGSAPCETAAPNGWLVDACKRAVGLPTQCHTEHPVHLLLMLWLDRLLVELTSSSKGLLWSDAVGLAPVPALTAHTPMTLGTEFASRFQTWARLRTDVALGLRLPVHVDAAHAAWMDTPMFARWCLGFFPDLDDLRNDIGFMATTRLAAGVEQTIRTALSIVKAGD